jgi:hypothetical protein
MELHFLAGQAQQVPNVVHLERFAYVIEGARFHRLDGGLYRRESRDHHHQRTWPALAHLAQELHATMAGHLEVGENEVELVPFEHFDGLRHGRGGVHGVAVLRQ